MKKLFLLTCFTWSMMCHAQDPLRFKDEVEKLTAADSTINKKNIILFTGSSSIVNWKTLKADFPNRNVLNRGFGGSEMSDLIFYADEVIYPYKAKKIFIYEGDNDIASERDINTVFDNYRKLLKMIREDLSPRTKVYFISPKPSIARWALKDKYQILNRMLSAWLDPRLEKNAFFIDVWTPMLEPDGSVKKDLFVEDGLHMNEKGYKIWKEVIGKYLQ